MLISYWQVSRLQEAIFFSTHPPPQLELEMNTSILSFLGGQWSTDEQTGRHKHTYIHVICETTKEKTQTNLASTLPVRHYFRSDLSRSGTWY